MNLIINSYGYNNPVKYSDPTGHCVDGLTTWACIAAGIAIATKVVDYGMTVYDSWQAGRTLADANASGTDKIIAGLTVGLSIVFEAIEPDDILPIGVPADDIARRAIVNGAEEALQEGGPEALEGFLRIQLGDHADDVIGKMDELLGLDPDSLYGASQVASGKQNLTAAGHALQKHANRQGDIWAQYLPEGTLNPANYNARASELVQDVLTNPGTVRSYHKDYIHYFAPDGRGLRFNLDGSFVGFVNP